MIDFNDFNWGSGRVGSEELNSLDPHLPLSDQTEQLKEDLAQVYYGERLLIDVGWYPEFSKDGNFVVAIIKDGDWDAPKLLLKAKTPEELWRCLEAAVVMAEEIYETQGSS